MADEVVTAPAESQAKVVTPEVAPVVATPESEEDVATWKKRLAGKDQALTAAQKALETVKSEAEQLKRWKAEQEQSNMSEFEKAQARLAALETELNATKEYARQEKIRSSAPNYAQFLADTAGLPEEARAVAFENYLTEIKKAQAVEKSAPTDSPKVNVPSVNTRKDAAPVGKKTIAELEEDLKKLGNPFFGM